ncbi:MAG: universal stress protein [Armatimonadota bacterium]|nr:universal stress protein [Armatimonadota bacterium]MDR7568306.1 universal stress protein [Armatimonadota bacterium]MDR7603025.1 universal stress protein [Armatimonadota bacterium]
MFRRVLVGYDGSDPARRALQAALDLAQRYGAAVTALAVARPPEFAELEAEVDAALMEARGPLAEAFRWAREQARKAGVDLHLRVQIGHPAEVLVRVAREEGFDLIVLGRRGLTPVQRWMLGSVSERVIRYAHCPVMVVH